MPVKVAGVQMDVAFAEPEKNLAHIAEFFETTCAAGAKLTVFPECALTGYCFESLDEARPVAETIPDRKSTRLNSSH
jgi:predicted amidohydrolase